MVRVDSSVLVKDVYKDFVDVCGSGSGFYFCWFEIAPWQFRRSTCRRILPLDTRFKVRGGFGGCWW